MTKNIFEELVAEIEAIVGVCFKVEVEAKGLNIYFERMKREEIRKALQRTVSSVMKNYNLRRFSFEEREISDSHSLASVFVRLLGAEINSTWPVGNQFVITEHLLECGGCQINLLKIIEHFTAELILQERRRISISKIFKKLFRRTFSPKKTADSVAVLQVVPAMLSLSKFLEDGVYVGSKEKTGILQRYIPLLIEKNIKAELVFDALVKSAKEKNEDLTAEEFEKILKELVGK